MTPLFKEKFKIDSHRLQNWDYSSEAVYFITIVTKDRKCIFGSVEEEKMILNENGKIVENELLKSIKIRKNWFFHNWVIMPNHIHLLIEIQNTDVSINMENTQNIVETHSSAPMSSISTTDISLLTCGRETHSSAPLQSQSNSDFLSETHIVETHRSASPSSISTTDISLSTYGRETHSSAPLQSQSDSDSLSETHIVETHCSASTSSISTTENKISDISLSTYGRETHSSAPLQSQSDSKNGFDDNQIQNQLLSKLSRKSNSISSFVAIFKSITTKQISGSESIWQANYHDHIVRNYKRFEKIYDYIKNNPRSWETDSLK
ncbi:hypothetical protein [Flavobacterium chungangensis]|uniref:Transposase IS200-like domain-containing protein n=1 Tax=Flavobacterium chungangensis TaxID=2708132 RepID=A0ABV8ZK65_9FLAO